MVTLVAGGAGFIGAHLCEALVRDGEATICLDNLSTGRCANIAGLLPSSLFTFIEHDITCPLPALPPLNAVYHLASPASPVAYQERPIETLRANSEGTHRLLELACEHGARFLFASTSEVYGDPLEHPQRETYLGHVSSVGPRSMYDEGKRYGEAMTVAYGKATGLAVRIARIFNTYGPRMDPADGRVISNFIVQALSGRPITIYGDGSQSRSFQYVDDLIVGLRRLIASDYAGPVNLGNPVEFTMLQLAAKVHELAGIGTGFEWRPLPQHDPRRRQPDITLARELLAWSPQIDLQAGLSRTISHFREVLMELGQTDGAVSIDTPPRSDGAAPIDIDFIPDPATLTAAAEMPPRTATFETL